MSKQSLEQAIEKINVLIEKAKTDSTIDVDDLKAERDNARRELNKIRRAKEVKRLFLIYFDGCYGIDSVKNTSNTFAMGVCKLEYKGGTLTVHLRRPGLLIGKGGCIINALAKHLGCKIDIVEVDLLK